MTKQDALITLIKQSILLTSLDKESLLGKIDTLSAEQIDEMGKFLALEQKTLSENVDQIETSINEVGDLLNDEATKRKTNNITE